MVALRPIFAGVLAIASTMLHVSAGYIGLKYQVSFTRFRVDRTFTPFSRTVCETRALGTDSFKQDHCKGWKKAPAFDHFSYSWLPNDFYGAKNSETPSAAKYGNCTLRIYKSHECRGPPVAEIENANDQRVEAKCEGVRGGEAHSAKVTCFNGNRVALLGGEMMEGK